MKYKPEFRKKVYREAVENQSWKFTTPVLDYGDIFQYEGVDTLSCYHTRTPVYEREVQAIAQQYLSKYTHNLPPLCGLSIFIDYFLLEQYGRPATWKESQLGLSDKTLRAFEYYLQHKLSDEQRFPFKQIFHIDHQLTCETVYGIRRFLHDVFQPMAYKANIPSLSRADLVRTVPTIAYEEPGKLCAAYPLNFLLCCPFFTYPREIPAMFGVAGPRLSLFDVFVSPYYETNTRLLGNYVSVFEENIKALCADVLSEAMTQAAITCFHRELILYGARPNTQYDLTNTLHTQATIRQLDIGETKLIKADALNEAVYLDNQERRERSTETAKSAEQELHEQVRNLYSEVRL